MVGVASVLKVPVVGNTFIFDQYLKKCTNGTNNFVVLF